MHTPTKEPCKMQEKWIKYREIYISESSFKVNYRKTTAHKIPIKYMNKDVRNPKRKFVKNIKSIFNGVRVVLVKQCDTTLLNSEAFITF